MNDHPSPDSLPELRPLPAELSLAMDPGVGLPLPPVELMPLPLPVEAANAPDAAPVPSITEAHAPEADTPPPLDPVQPPPEAHVPLGLHLPDTQRVPTLTYLRPNAAPPGHSTLATGMSFVGRIQLTGSLTVGGAIEGPVIAMTERGGNSHVIVAETGVVRGDIIARNITVQGRTSGLLDAPGGRVTLHDGSVVEGRVRYTTLQVNGADLNAQLERVRPESDPTSVHRG